MLHRPHRSDPAPHPARTARRDLKLERIAAVPLFAGCRRDALVELGRTFELCSVGPGTVLEVEDERASSVTVVVEGSALATRRGVPAGLVGAGDCFGERASLGHGPSVVTIRALGEMVLLMADVRAARTLAARHPALSEQLAAARLLGVPTAMDKAPLSPTVRRSKEPGRALPPPRPALSRRGDDT
jgi:CRP-like cAMP-binding protein